MNALRIKQALCFLIAVVMFASCKKKDPDCATCPCPLCPRIDSLIPNHGRPGDTLILKGVNFNADPLLNLVTFNDTLVQEVLEATATELKVVVPEGTTTGPVGIKINDEDTLGSDEIPEFNEPLFTIDRFVELVAGMPSEQAGDDDGSLLDAKFKQLSKIAIDSLSNRVFILDENLAGEQTIRKIENSYTTTLYVSSSIIDDLTQPISNNIYFPYSGNYSGFKCFSILNQQLSTFTSQSYSSGFHVYAEQCVYDESSGYIYYLLIRNADSKNYLMRVSLINSNLKDTLIKFQNEVIDNDFEVFNGYIYGVQGSSIVRYPLNSTNSNKEIIADNLSTAWSILGLAIDKNGIVFYSKDNQIFKIGDNGQSLLVAGALIAGYNPQEATGVNSLFNTIRDIDFDKDNNLYIVDAGNNCIRKLKID